MNKSNKSSVSEGCKIIPIRTSIYRGRSVDSLFEASVLKIKYNEFRLMRDDKKKVLENQKQWNKKLLSEVVKMMEICAHMTCIGLLFERNNELKVFTRVILTAHLLSVLLLKCNEYDRSLRIC